MIYGPMGHSCAYACSQSRVSCVFSILRRRKSHKTMCIYTHTEVHKRICTHIKPKSCSPTELQLQQQDPAMAPFYIVRRPEFPLRFSLPIFPHHVLIRIDVPRYPYLYQVPNSYPLQLVPSFDENPTAAAIIILKSPGLCKSLDLGHT